MIVFIKTKEDGLEVICTPVKDILLVDGFGDSTYKKTFPKLLTFQVVPWFKIQEDPVVFGAWLLAVAAKDQVCVAMMQRATEQWKMDFSIKDGQFVSKMVQEQYHKLLRNWLSPLSGNINRNESHTVDLKAIENLANVFGLNLLDLTNIAKNEFFSLKMNGRRDRMQIYRNVTEAARALVGEVTTWPSRQVEKMVTLSLLGSQGLLHYQCLMLKEALAFAESLKCTMWEYLPYYLRGKVLEKADDEFCRIRVLGALHDCLRSDKETAKLADGEIIERFELLDEGVECRRWRLLPEVIRCQVMISDLARMFGFGKMDCEHQRVEFDHKYLNTLPDSLSKTPIIQIRAHKTANPNDPGIKDIRFTAGWNRNEFCPNVVTSRLLLAPLYAGTSGHTQGRILAWRALQEKGAKLKDVPVGMVIATGYAVLWRLYYDKRVSGFHTLFEALQGTHVDQRKESKVEKMKNDLTWNLLVDHSPGGLVDVCSFWRECLQQFGCRGRGFELVHKEALANIRISVSKQCKGCVVLHWSDTDDTSLTAPQVSVWSDEKNRKELLGIYDKWLNIAANTPLPEPDEEEIEFFKN
jgi:hypothetical protein